MDKTQTFSPLICIHRVEETSDSATFEFKSVDDSPFTFKPGQFITFEVEIAMQPLYRAYSICSSPADNQSVAVTIKRVPGGKVSNHLMDHLQPGVALPALSPAGEFNLIDLPATNRLLLMSAGSGITPCMSMALWTLEKNPKVDVQFIYSARSKDDVIKAKQLTELDSQHPQFHLSLILENGEANQGVFPGLLDAPLFEQLVPDLTGRTIFTCGPQGYMAALETLAKSRSFNPDYFHQESFTPAPQEQTEGQQGITYGLAVPAFAKQGQIQSEQTLLDALEQQEVPIIGACRSGVCGSCKCQVTQGEVSSSSQATLTPEEIDAGYVLACSSKAKTDLEVSLA